MNLKTTLIRWRKTWTAVTTQSWNLPKAGLVIFRFDFKVGHRAAMTAPRAAAQMEAARAVPPAATQAGTPPQASGSNPNPPGAPTLVFNFF
jgi:hypothetical protein